MRDHPTCVRVFLLSLTRDAERLACLREWLSQDETIRAQRFLKETDRKRFILGRGILRVIAAAYLNVEPAKILFNYTSAGKPFLGNPIPIDRQRWEFNVAHSGDCVLVAWSEGEPIGVDVELIRQRMATSLDDVASSFFSQPERSVISAAQAGEVIATFYRIWVRKEAVLKAEGCGIGGASRSFSVVRRRRGHTEWLDYAYYPESRRMWKIVDLNLVRDHRAALALSQDSTIQALRVGRSFDWHPIDQDSI